MHHYRADIDGLRAVAIVPVVLFHAGVPHMAGGFVGAWIAMYASSNGHESNNHVDFDWFEYAPLNPENPVE